jgi:hypothetical protein
MLVSSGPCPLSLQRGNKSGFKDPSVLEEAIEAKESRQIGVNRSSLVMIIMITERIEIYGPQIKIFRNVFITKL